MILLKIVGWIFIPYVMVFVQWKKLTVPGRIIGSIWALILFSRTFSPMINKITQPAPAIALTSTQTHTTTGLNKSMKNTNVPEVAKTTHLVMSGIPAMVGKLQVTINSLQETQYVGQSGFGDTANGIYWVIGVTIKNEDNQSRTIDDSMFQIQGRNGDTFNPDTTAEMDITNNNNLFFEGVNPGVSISGYVVFDMPAYETSGNIGENYVLNVSSEIGLFSSGQSKSFSMYFRHQN